MIFTMLCPSSHMLLSREQHQERAKLGVLGQAGFCKQWPRGIRDQIANASAGFCLHIGPSRRRRAAVVARFGSSMLISHGQALSY